MKVWVQFQDLGGGEMDFSGVFASRQGAVDAAQAFVRQLGCEPLPVTYESATSVQLGTGRSGPWYLIQQKELGS